MAKVSPLKLLTAEELDTIYEKSLAILSSKGVKVTHVQALRILDKAGAQVDFDSGQVRFPKDLTETALRSVPHGSTLAAGNECYDIVLPHPRETFYTRPGSGPLLYLEPESNTYRDVTLTHQRETAQLIEILDDINLAAILSPRDVPKETVDIHSVATLLQNTSKHVSVQPYSIRSIEYLFQLGLAVTGSAEALKKRPRISLLSCSLSPLQLKDMDTEVIIQSCRYGLPIEAWTLPGAGGTSPITIAGTVLLMSTEILATLVMSQLIAPGTPVIGGILPFTLDMATGKNLQGSVEGALIEAATVQFIKETFHIPTYTFGFASDSPLVDAQSMIETTLKGLLTSMAGSDILSGAGMLDAISAFSPIQLILDSILAGILKRVISGVKVDDDTLAWKEIMETGPGDNFLEQPHTLKHCREALRPELFVRTVMEVWRSQGGKDLYARAVDKYRELKNKLQPQQLPSDVQREIDLIVKRADERLAK